MHAHSPRPRLPLFLGRAHATHAKDLRKNAAVNTLSKAHGPRLRHITQAREPMQKPGVKTPKNEASTL